MNQKTKILTVAVACILQVSFVNIAIASDKYGGGGSSGGGSNRSGVSGYSVSGSGRSTTVTNISTGDYTTLSDWNGDGKYNGPNENVSGNNNRGDNDNGNNRYTSCYPITCSSAGNYCGKKGSGTRSSCGGVCSAAVPANTTCTSLPLDQEKGLVLDPTIVRSGNETTITWDLGTNYPPVCRLNGQGFETFTFAPGDKTGSATTTVTGPHRYTLTCGTSEVRKDIRVLPVLYES